jgi:hypothetical protein
MNLMRLPRALSLRPILAVLGAALAVGLTVAVPRASAANCPEEFSGAFGTDWTTAANWSTGSVPTAGQDVCIAASASSVEIKPGVAAKVASIDAHSLVFIEAGGSLTLTDGNTLGQSEFEGLSVKGRLSTEGASIVLGGQTTVEGEITGTNKLTYLDGGSLAGNGTIATRFVAEDGTVEPGPRNGVGTLHFDAYTSTSSATLILDLASDSSFDRITAGPTTNPSVFGKIEAHLVGDYTPAVGTSWEFIGGTYGVMSGWTVDPAQFSAHGVPGGAALQLDTALPADPDPIGGGGATGAGPGAAGTAPGTSPLAPGGAPSPVILKDESWRMMRGCGVEQLALDDVYAKGRRVLVSGIAPTPFAGRQVQIVLAGKGTVATATVAPDGRFVGAAPLPAHPAKASYTATLAGMVTNPFVLRRDFVLETPRLVGGKVLLVGQVARPRTTPATKVLVYARTVCEDGAPQVASFKLGAGGRFRAEIPAPDAGAVAYTLMTKVPKGARPHSSSASSLAVPLLLE